MGAVMSKERKIKTRKAKKTKARKTKARSIRGGGLGGRNIPLGAVVANPMNTDIGTVDEQ